VVETKIYTPKSCTNTVSSYRRDGTRIEVGNCTLVREHARSFGQDSGSSALIFWATRKYGCTHLSVGTWGRRANQWLVGPYDGTATRQSGTEDSAACQRPVGL